MMLSLISLDSSGTRGVLVAMAIIGSTAVAAEKDLCNKWKDGDVAVLTMGLIAKDGDFLVMDVDFNGLQVPLSQFKHDSETTLLDLQGAKQLHLDVPSSMSKPTSSMGFFIYNPGQAEDNNKFNINETCLGFLSSDLKKLTMVPLNGEQERHFQVSMKANSQKMPSQILLAASDYILFRKEAKNGTHKFATGFQLEFSSSDVVKFYSSVSEINVQPVSSAIESGYVHEEKGIDHLSACYGISNQEKAVHVLKPQGSSVQEPFQQFFVCSSGSTEDPSASASSSHSSSNMGLIYGGIGAIIALLILVGIGFFLFTKGKKTSTDKSLTKSTTGKGSKTSKKGKGKSMYKSKSKSKSKRASTSKISGKSSLIKNASSSSSANSRFSASKSSVISSTSAINSNSSAKSSTGKSSTGKSSTGKSSTGKSILTNKKVASKA